MSSGTTRSSASSSTPGTPRRARTPRWTTSSPDTGSNPSWPSTPTAISTTHAGRRTPQGALRHSLRPLGQGPLPAGQRLGERLGLRREGGRDAPGGDRPRRHARNPLRTDDPPRDPHPGPHPGPRGVLRAAGESALHGRHALPRVDRPHGPAGRRLLVDHAFDPRLAASAGRRGARLSRSRSGDDHRPRNALQPLHRRGAERRGELQN